jgi:hypothetical protein
MEVIKIGTLFEQKIANDSKRVTAGDPKSFSNRASDLMVNTGRRPELPKDKKNG